MTQLTVSWTTKKKKVTLHSDKEFSHLVKCDIHIIEFTLNLRTTQHKLNIKSNSIYIYTESL